MYKRQRKKALIKWFRECYFCHFHDHINVWSQMYNTHIFSVFFFSFLKTQVAERNQNQICGWAPTGRGGLLRPVWQETKAVPRCDEGTSASKLYSLIYIHDTKADVLRHTDEQLSL